MEETLNFAANVTKIFNVDDIEVKRMVLRILGSDLVLKDRLVRIDGKKAFIYLKKYENAYDDENGRLGPEKGPINGDKGSLSENNSDMERVTRVELVFTPWKGVVEPLNYTRLISVIN